jgi:hypothetical protein
MVLKARMMKSSEAGRSVTEPVVKPCPILRVVVRLPENERRVKVLRVLAEVAESVIKLVVDAGGELAVPAPRADERMVELGVAREEKGGGLACALAVAPF